MNERLNTFMRWSFVLISIIVVAIGSKNSLEAIQHEENVMSELRFVDEIEEKVFSFAAWEASCDEVYYLVLPSAYLHQDFKVKLSYEDRFYSIYIDEERYMDGDSWTESLQEEMHQIKIVDLFGNVRMEKAFQILISGNVPAIMVTVEAKEELVRKEEYANKQYVEKGDITVLDESGKLVFEDAMERFKVRGNLTATFEKNHLLLLCKKKYRCVGYLNQKIGIYLLMQRMVHILEIKLCWTGQMKYQVCISLMENG